MNLSDRAIERPRLIILGAILVCMLGIAAIFTLPKERTPRVKIPVIVAAVPNPGGQPPTNEREIIRRIEEEIGVLSNLKDRGYINSEAVNGAAIFQIVFNESIDVKEAKRDVESLFNRVKGEFPALAQTDPGPIVNDVSFENWPIIQVFIAGGEDGVERRRIAEKLQDQIETVPGIAGVDLFGGLEEEIIIEINPHTMALYGFSYEQIDAALRKGNVESPSGTISGGDGGETRVRLPAKFKDMEAIRDLPVGLNGGKPVTLQDIAVVRRGHKELESIARYDGIDAVVLLARGQTEIDVWATANRVQDLVDEFNANMEGGDAQIGTVRSQAREIAYMIQQLGTSAVYGTLLVVIILWLALGWRNATLISSSLPLAILGTAGIMWIAKRTVASDLAINNMTMFATILVIGLVVDGCIIVGENIFRHRELGEPPLMAAKRGIHEVGGSLMGAYLTTFFAFAPMFLLRGIMGDFMEQMPIVVLFALCSAMLVDHFLMPMLSVYFMRVSKKRQKQIDKERKEDGSAGQQLTPEELEIRNAERSVNASRMKRAYGGMLNYALRHRLMVLVMTLGAIATPVVLFQKGAIGLEFFPDTDMPIVEVNFELPLGSSMEGRTGEVAKLIEAAVLRSVKPEEWYRPSEDAPRVRPVTTMGSPGALNIRLDVATGTGPEFGMVYVELELAESRERSSKEIRDAIRREMPPLPGVIVRVTSPSEGPPSGAPVQLRIAGQKDVSIEQLAERAAEIEELLKGTPGVYDVSNDFRLRPELLVEPNRAVARLFDIESSDIARAVNYALAGQEAGEVDFGAAESIDLRIRNQRGDRDQLTDLKNLPLRSSTGKIVNVDQVADVDRVMSPNVIRHYDGKRVVNLRAELQEGVTVEDVKRYLVASLRPELNSQQQEAISTNRHDRVLKADSDVIVEFGGEVEIRDDAMEDLGIAIVVAVILMMITLTVKLNSFVQPLIVLFSVPLSLIGVSIGLMICGFSFSISAMIGVVALAGIVVNDAIVLVDFVNRLKRAGVPIRKAVVYAGQLRLRPIILTTLTTISGLLPLSLNIAGGGEFWQPLTVTIMFGLGFATLLQLFIIPILCYTFDFGASLLDPSERPEYAGTPEPLVA